ncbi:MULTISPECIES: TrkA family potassium uptake protein [unclassified Thermotoga]|uniref:potassium channel family protein n=1 Tax=unclassified Thermotoga TaxID=2631113 RepID=UPI000280E6D5|nr:MULTISPECIES: potassium channel protein [unclassified Thermotoga]AIY87272.1 TrkA-N domain protein [Thermotoga sp. 2812B]EJX26460.1 TrkA-N domain protein [Thermotoga sp. EMP]
MKKNVIILALMIVFVFVFGTVAFHLIEGWSLFDSFFFTLITVSTVGYSIPENLSQAGKVIASILISAGVTIVLYGFTSVTSMIVEGHIGEYFRNRRMKKMIDKLKEHFIVVGAGRTGRHTTLEIMKAKKPFVVIDQSEEAIARLKDFLGEEFPYVVGDATEEEILMKAGVERARSLVVTLPDDAKSTFVVLTAKSLNPNLEIVSRVSDMKALSKLVYAGADKVIATSELAGVRLAQMALNPTTISFLDILSFGEESFRIEEVVIPPESPVANKTLGEINLAKRAGTIVIAIRRGGEVIFNPTGDTKILPEDRLMVVGKSDHFEKLHRLIEEG